MFEHVLPNGNHLRLTALSPRLFRYQLIPAGGDFASSLIRYGLVRGDWPETDCRETLAHGRATLATPAATLSVDLADGSLRLEAGKSTLASAAAPAVSPTQGFAASFRLHEAERVFGLGDVTRERLNKRGFRTEIWVRNVAAYVPIPLLVSERGWGLFTACTWRHYFDVGAGEPGLLRLGGRHGGLDLYLFAGDFRQIVDQFTQLTGRPALLPLWGYGLTFVCNQQADAREMLDDCLNLRREQIPCDLVGLEPGWMSQYYDASVDKKWHPERFYIPPWVQQGPPTFLGALERLGFKLSLWECCDYDLTFEADRQAARTVPPPPQAADADVRHPDDFERDQHFGHTPMRMDKLTKPEQPWFEHLKKFVDQGVAAFKMDGAYQVNEHPDRCWGNGMSDEECHNLYPTLLNQQMSDGFAAHTGRRAMIYSSGGYTGIQRFAATWAGDTGGGPKPLASMLNHGFVGHSNVSCDMDVFTPQGIHFGFLQSWSQVNSWAYWRHPWLLGETLLPIFKDYAQLRYRLLPYLYSMAHLAHASGWPMMRAMSLVHPEDPACDERLQQYYLGDGLLVGAFTDTVYLPAGNWYCWWTGTRYEGGREQQCALPAGRGGPLLVRGGAIVPLWPDRQYVGQRPIDVVYLHVWPGGNAEFTLCEDDGVSLAHDRGEVARTAIATRQDEGTFTVTVSPTAGSYAGMPADRRFELVLHGLARPAALRLNGNPVAEGKSGWQLDATGELRLPLPPASGTLCIVEFAGVLLP